jgi:DNA-binding NarL/FixJ family response regulator
MSPKDLEALAQTVSDHLPLGPSDPERVTTVIIEPRLLVRECLLKWMASAGGEGSVLAYATVGEWLSGWSGKKSDLLILLCTDDRPELQIAADIARLGEVGPDFRIVLLSDEEDLGRIVTALNHGVHGYIPTSLSLEVALEVLHLVRKGGMFVPASAVLSARNPHAEQKVTSPQYGDVGLTARQAVVLDALRKGKPNKVIANELNMCESTVKVHVRNIMKKLNAKNRTEIAFRISNGFGNGHANG